MNLIVPLAFTLLLAVYGFHSWGHLPWSTDTLLFVLPDFSLNAQLYAQGRLPLWNENLGCGVPQWADWISGCLYPPAFLGNRLGWDHFLLPLVLLHEAWAFAGMVLWLRSQKASQGFSYLGAFSFCGSAHFIRCWLSAPFAFTLAWTPWVFWSVQYAIGKPGKGRWLLALFPVSLQILAGYPFFTFYTWVLLGAWFLSLRPTAGQWSALAGILTGSLALTCAQWLPFLEFMSDTVRGGWATYPYFTSPIECSTLLQPGLAGDPSNFSYRGSPANGNFGNLYFGFLPFLLFIASWAMPRRIQAKVWNFSALGFFLWSMGVHFPPLGLIPRHWLEFLDPSKAVGLFLFSACTSVAITGSKWTADHRFPSPGRPWRYLLGALWVLDLMILPSRLLHWVPNPYQDPSIRTEWTGFSERIRGFRVLSLQSRSQWTYSDLRDYAEKNIRWLMMNSNQVWGIRSANGYGSTITPNLFNLSKYFKKGYPFQGDLLDVAGVRALILPQVPAGDKYKLMGRVGEDFLLSNEKAAPRGWFTPGSRFFPDRPSILSFLSRPGTPWRSVVFLERSGDGPPVHLERARRSLDPGTLPGVPGWGMNFQVRTVRPGFWGFNETWFPGWYAWVDGDPVPILRAYGLFMAVELPAGNHLVQFRYEPVSLRLGLFLSLVGVLGAAFLGLAAWTRFKALSKGA